MRRSKSEIYLHLVWTTWKREPFITSELRDRLYSFLEMQIRHLGCQVLAIGGMPDHIHVVVSVPTTVCAAQLLKQVKGSSSAFVNDFTGRTPYFRWQEGAGIFSLCPPFLAKVIRYVENQEHHHTSGPLWATLEETTEEVQLPAKPALSSRPKDASPSE